MSLKMQEWFNMHFYCSQSAGGAINLMASPWPKQTTSFYIQAFCTQPKNIQPLLPGRLKEDVTVQNEWLSSTSKIFCNPAVFVWSVSVSHIYKVIHRDFHVSYHGFGFYLMSEWTLYLEQMVTHLTLTLNTATSEIQTVVGEGTSGAIWTGR